jgi:hypothetical protein
VVFLFKPFDILEIEGIPINWEREYRFLQFYKKRIYGNRLSIYPEDAAFVRFEDGEHRTFYFYESSSSLKSEAIVSSCLSFVSKTFDSSKIGVYIFLEQTHQGLAIGI